MLAFIGASIHGAVVDNQTGRPVARTIVVAQPIAGTNGAARSARTDLNGAFEFSDLAAGAWLLVASRRGFAPTRVPVKDDTGDVVIRLRRFGAISGTVVDENDVGLQELEVVAYRNIHPPVVVSRAKTDDRGVYRLEGLEPGTFFVRSAAREDDEGSYLPAVSRETIVQFDREVSNVDLHPIAGRLLTLAGRAVGPSPVTVFLVSEMGVQQTAADAAGNFRFPPVAPGQYELYAQGRDAAAWQSIPLYGDVYVHRVTLAPFPELRLAVEDSAGRPIDPANAHILVRRRDLASEGKTDTLRGQGRVLAPGRYEFALAPSTSWYAVAVNGNRPRADAWAEVLVSGQGPVEVKFTLSSRPATLRGVVRNPAGAPVAGIPVRLDGLRMVMTDVRGQFEFYGLPPGEYRVGVEDAALQTIGLQEGQDQTIDLDLRAAQ